MAQIVGGAAPYCDLVELSPPRESELPPKKDESSLVMFMPPDDFSRLRKGDPPPLGAVTAPRLVLCLDSFGLVELVAEGSSREGLHMPPLPAASLPPHAPCCFLIASMYEAPSPPALRPR